MKKERENMKNFTCWMMKTSFLKSDLKRLAKDVVPDTAEYLYQNENYYEDGEERHNFDVLVPKGSTGKLPCIINIHGGGFCACTKDIYDNYVRRMASEGFVVININYSLAPKHPFPEGVEDCVAAINYCLARKEKYRMTDDYFVMGDSAGANLTATMGLIASNPEYASLMNLKLDEKMKGIYLSCGCYSFYDTDEQKYPLDLKPLYFQKKPKNYPDRKKYELYESLTSDFPPTFITSCADDFMYHDNLRMEAELKKLGVQTVSCIYDETHNPLGHVFNYKHISDEGKLYPEAIEVREVSTKFFKELIAK